MRCKGWVSGNKGQTLVEFALVLSLLLLILFGITEFGRFWFFSNHLGNSVRAAARYGAVVGNKSTTAAFVNMSTESYCTREITTYLGSDVLTASPPSGFVTPSGVVATVKRKSDGTLHDDSYIPVKGDTLEVQATIYFTFYTAGMVPYFNTPRPMVRSATMPIER